MGDFIFNATVCESPKDNMDPNNSTCCICWRSGLIVKTASKYQSSFSYLTGFENVVSDEIGLWICLECIVHLLKACKFKEKVIKSNAILRKGLAETEGELKPTPSSTLTASEILTFICEEDPDINDSFSVFYHSPIFIEPDLTIKIEKADDFHDYDDNVNLADVQSEKNNKNIKTKKAKKRLVKKQTEEKVVKTARVINKPQPIDPEKIRTIILTREEQIKQRELEAQSDKYLKFPFKCEKCVKGFNFEHKLNNHILNKHNKARGKFYCDLCTMRLPSKFSFKIHQNVHSLRYECLVCHVKMSDLGRIKEHYDVTHDGIFKLYTCEICKMQFSNKMTYRGHMKNKHSTIRPACHYCGKDFVNKDSLVEHLMIHESIKLHECKICLKKFRTTSQLKSHKLSHTEERKFYCVECDKRFKSLHNFRSHLFKAKPHRDPASLKFSCPKCGERFDSPSSLQHHITWGHEKQRVYLCDTCDMRFATRSSMQKHVAVTHLGIVPARKFLCGTCGRAFRSRTTLGNHLRTHTGEKPFECSFCMRKFAQKSALASHNKRIHLKVQKKTTKHRKSLLTIKSETDLKEYQDNATPPPSRHSWQLDHIYYTSGP